MTQVIGHLGTLESAGLIRLAQLQPELEYLFRHALVQDAAYASLLVGDQKRLHQVVGQTVERLYADRLDEHAAMLALHFERAGDAPLALHYLIRAGDVALASYANQEAEGYLRRALDLRPTPAERALLLSRLGEALFRLSRFDEAHEEWLAGIDHYRSLGDLDGVARLYARAARAAWYAGDTPKGLRLCQEGLAVVEGAPPSPDLARLLHETARAYHFNGLPDEALPLIHKALELAEHLNAVDVEADTLTTLAVLRNQPPDQSLGALRRAVQLAEAAGLLQVAARAHHNLGVMIGEVEGDQHAALEHFARSAEISRMRGVASEERLSRMNAVGHRFALGRFADAEADMARLEELAASMPESSSVQGDLNGLRAGMLWAQGEQEEAARLLRAAVVDARHRGNLQTIYSGDSELAWYALELDRQGMAVNWEEAEAALQEALSIAERGLGRTTRPLSLLAVVRARQGRVDEAHRILDRTREAAAAGYSAWDKVEIRTAEGEVALVEKDWPGVLEAAEDIASAHAARGARWNWAYTLERWADAHRQRGTPADLERAQTLLREALAAYELMGATYRAAQVQEALADLRAEIQARAVALEKTSRELAVAGRIQSGLLPEEVPELPGWQLAVALQPARETSGDFYDLIPLPGGRLGIVVADVADKGAGAALYMALTRTLIRTYAAEYPDQPGRVLAAANERILAETHTNMFVTIFYGVLDPATGALVYANAGHNPPHLLSSTTPEALGLVRTGMALGVVAASSWERAKVQIQPSEVLVLYTDGVIDALNAGGARFGEERLLATARAAASSGGSAPEVQQAILDSVEAFVAGLPPFDDLTLMVLTRSPVPHSIEGPEM